MYNRTIDDDDDCTLHTRGDEIRSHLRRACLLTNRITNAESQEAMSEVIEAMRLISEVLYELCDPHHRPVRPTTDSPYSLS